MAEAVPAAATSTLKHFHRSAIVKTSCPAQAKTILAQSHLWDLIERPNLDDAVRHSAGRLRYHAYSLGQSCGLNDSKAGYRKRGRQEGTTPGFDLGSVVIAHLHRFACDTIRAPVLRSWASCACAASRIAGSVLSYPLRSPYPIVTNLGTIRISFLAPELLRGAEREQSAGPLSGTHRR